MDNSLNPIEIGVFTNEPRLASRFWSALDKGQWRTASGDILDLMTMDEDHLINCIGFLQRRLKNVDEQISTMCSRISIDPMLFQNFAHSLPKFGEEQFMLEGAITKLKEALKSRNSVANDRIDARKPVLPAVVEDTSDFDAFKD